MNLRTVYIKYFDKKNDSKEHKCVVFLFRMLQIFYGLDLGFFTLKPLKFRFILKTTWVIHCVGITAAMLMYQELCGTSMDLGKFWTILFFIEYLVLILMLSLMKRGSTFMDFQESLEEIDDKLRINHWNKRTDLIFILTIFVIYTQHFFIGSFCYLTASYRYTCVTMSDLYVFVMLTPCADVSVTCYTLIFYSIYLRLSKILLMLETDDYDLNLRLYKEIVDCVEKYKKAFDPVYMLILLCNIPQVMATIYFTLIELQNRANIIIFVRMGITYLYALEVLALTIAPALAAEMLTTKAEEIKTILHNKILLTDVQHKEALRRFIQYVEARPCRFRVWKLVPLSADLLSMVLSFCVTYLIVIVQLTNLQINN